MTIAPFVSYEGPKPMYTPGSFSLETVARLSGVDFPAIISAAGECYPYQIKADGHVSAEQAVRIIRKATGHD